MQELTLLAAVLTQAVGRRCVLYGDRGENTETIHQLFPVELLKAAALLPQVGCEWGK